MCVGRRGVEGVGGGGGGGGGVGERDYVYVNRRGKNKSALYLIYNHFSVLWLMKCFCGFCYSHSLLLKLFSFMAIEVFS